MLDVLTGTRASDDMFILAIMDAHPWPLQWLRPASLPTRAIGPLHRIDRGATLQMMTSSSPSRLLRRLDDIGTSLSQSGHALALIGLGSVGQDTRRLDEYPDLDFFAIVEPGHKARYVLDRSISERTRYLARRRQLVER